MRLTRTSGITLLETMVSCAILAICLTTLGTLATETLTFLRSNDVEAVVEIEGGRAMERLTDTLRKSGRVDVGGGVVYPRAVTGGTALQFLVLADLDGNGYAFDATTGSVEWAATVFTARVDTQGNFNIYDDTGNVAYSLGRFVRNLTFTTNAENPALGLKEVEVVFQTQRTAPDGGNVIRDFRRNIYLRN
jgi:type II secretory pathway pseudopilin PulG